MGNACKFTHKAITLEFLLGECLHMSHPWIIVLSMKEEDQQRRHVTDLKLWKLRPRTASQFVLFHTATDLSALDWAYEYLSDTIHSSMIPATHLCFQIFYSPFIAHMLMCLCVGMLTRVQMLVKITVIRSNEARVTDGH